jgi:hypothetical protein
MRIPEGAESLSVYDGKYTFYYTQDKGLSCLRYGEMWMDSFVDVRGSNATLQLFFAAQEMRQLLEEIGQEFDPESGLGPRLSADHFERIKKLTADCKKVAR